MTTVLGWIRRGPLPWHPLVFGAVIVLTLWLDAAISPYAMVRSLLVVVVLAAAVTALAGLATRSVALGGLIGSAVILLLWSKQLLSLADIAISRMGVGLAVVWIALVAVALVIVGRLLRRSVRTWSVTGATSFLNRAALALMLATLALGLLNGRLGEAARDLEQGADLSAWPGTSESVGSTPDIYAILLDGYPRADVLDFAFSLDNTPFVDELARRGFDVAAEGHSDYLWTHVSVPSALNLAYVEDIPEMLEVIEERRPRQPTVRRLVAESRAFDLVGEQGYTTVGVSSGFEEVAARQADIWIDGGQMNEFEIILLGSTFAGDIINVVAPDFVATQQRDRILFNLDVLPDIAALPDRGPAFVFAHVPAPHQPVVMDGDGEVVPVPVNETFFADSPMERGQTHEEFVERYRAQLPYLNQRVLSAIDEIVAASNEPPIIVLFADHGSASRVDWITAHVETANEALLLERTGTLFAALTPGKESVYPEDVSPVDLFRLLFDAYFGTDFGRAVPPEGGGQIAPIDASVLTNTEAGP